MPIIAPDNQANRTVLTWAWRKRLKTSHGIPRTKSGKTNCSARVRPIRTRSSGCICRPITACDAVDEPIQTYACHMFALLTDAESLAEHEEYSITGEKWQCSVRGDRYGVQVLAVRTWSSLGMQNRLDSPTAIRSARQRLMSDRAPVTRVAFTGLVHCLRYCLARRPRFSQELRMLVDMRVLTPDGLLIAHHDIWFRQFQHRKPEWMSPVASTALS
jgi:hypothetical protein